MPNPAILGRLLISLPPIPFLCTVQVLHQHCVRLISTASNPACLMKYRYYTNIVYDSMKEDQPYDSIPNFTVGEKQGGSTLVWWPRCCCEAMALHCVVGCNAGSPLVNNAGRLCC